ncbi:MAG TPA: heparan-alpha-glucosaminide N-acetyltransferase domain-containing protein [Gemmatimonadales bacterium]|nr:heparan-alpha-glucosaminide N-acetyltransferase domain-containing protein [Gemmatimonadales bacterium]
MPAQLAVKRVRIESVDLVRGIIMILMALDHVRDFFGALGANPTDLATTTPGLFLTRWITHICAPVFFLLTGTGAWFSGRRRSRNGLARFLVTRGLWLILLELTVMRFLLQFNFDYKVTIITVLWALGWSMIVLAGLIYLPTWLIAVTGSVMIAGHNLLDGVQASSFGALAPLWNVLHGPGFLVNSPEHVVLVSYALIPWVGVTALGYVLGQLYHWEAERRRRWLLGLGLALTAAFVLLRFMNVYGDPVPWSAQKSPVFTVLSFMNANKYPPSLLFLLMTLGPALLLLRLFDDGVPAWLRPALVYGKVPLFYFILHFMLIHLLAVAAAWIRFGDVSGLFQSPSLDRFPFSAPPGWPASLPVIYLIWAGVVIALYPVCRWYAGVKARRGDWWVSYL